MSNVIVRGFVGLNYDSSVPGVQAPARNVAFTGSSVPPASIRFEHETSYYAGGGLVVKFAP